ncbi:MAG TPA: hypothetical protein VF506_04270 [Streptosporangiaceae bacterium]
MRSFWKARLTTISVAAATGAATIATALITTGCGPAAHAAGSTIPASVIGRLTTIASGAARVNGDTSPAWATVVVTTRARALTSATPGDHVPHAAHVRVYLITMHGKFVANAASRPPGSMAPSGRYLSLVIDARTFRSLDSGISQKPPPVRPASLGPLTHLHLKGSR